MVNKEAIISGCGNCNSFTGVCEVMFKKGAQRPTLAREAQISPPGEIEGPQTSTIKGLVCTVARSAELQKTCSDFVARTEADNVRNENI